MIEREVIRPKLSFDDPKPKRERRAQQLIYMLPSLRDRVDSARGKRSRSEWIERAILRAFEQDAG